jgi:hypothetical protein
MAIRIGVGGESFDRLREEKCYYVDKTELIYELVNSGNTVSLFTRPRRFGKTLAINMIKTFFEKSEEDTSRYFIDKKSGSAVRSTGPCRESTLSSC